MDMNTPYWLYIEPYVYISAKKDKAILYNTLNGKTLEYKENPGNTAIVRKLLLARKSYLLDLSPDELKDNLIKRFIKKIRHYYFGDLIRKSSTTARPVQIMPVKNVYQDVYRLDEEKNFAFGRNILNALNTITFYITNQTCQKDDIFKKAYKQFLFSYSGKRTMELRIGDIKKFLHEAQGSSLKQVNILGGNIFTYSKFDELYHLLHALDIMKVYFAHYFDIALTLSDKIERNKNIFLSMIADQKNHIKIFVNFPLKEELFIQAVEFIRENKPEAEYIFIIESKKTLDEAYKLISRLSINNYALKPYYNKKNYSFFCKYVFVSKKSLFKETTAYREIFGRMTINFNNFGSLIVFYNNRIYANPNKPLLGKLGRDSLYEIVYKELFLGRSWRNLRKNVFPCRNCLYNFLCPPLSNYEYVMKKNNLCNLINKFKEKP